MARGQAHDAVQRELGEWDSMTDKQRAYSRGYQDGYEHAMGVKAEIRRRADGGEPIHEIGDDLDARECNGR